MKRILIKPIKMPFWAQDLVLAFPRIVYGSLLAFNFGAAKFGMPWSPEEKNLNLFEVAFWFPGNVADFGPPFSWFPIFFAWMAAFSEAVGGIFWMIGLQTRITSFLIFCTMIPNYIMGCKRILVSNKYYPSFNRKNVELVTNDILELTEDSIITQDGKKRAIDCLIYGTGFVTDPRIYLNSFSCTGLNHVELIDTWKDGAESYYGISTKGFPNLFQLLGPNTVLGYNSVIFMIESQVNYILQLIEMAQKTQSEAIVVKADIQDQFNQHLQSQFTDTIWQSGCVSWYLQEDGKNFSLWPSYTWKYWLKTRKANPADYRFLNSKQDSQAIN